MSRTNFDMLLQAGCHFGHLKRKWNPAMAPYIFMERNGIHIIDLHKTVAKIDEAADALKQIAKSGKKILFVATKKQTKDVVAEKAASVNMPYVMKEAIAVKEANRLGIPVFAIVDTNSDPKDVDFMIPANDDAKDSVEVILNACCAAIAEGLEERKVEKADEKAAKEQAEANAIEDKPKRARKARKDAPAKEEEAAKAEETAEEAPAEA